jgi:hypothetical protein
MGKESAGGKQNGCGAAASRLVGEALSAIPVSSSERTSLCARDNLVGLPAPPRASAGGVFAITHHSTSRIRKGGGEDGGRRIPFVSCRSSWR